MLNIETGPRRISRESAELLAAAKAKIYRQIARDNPGNPTAALRAEWLEKIAVRLLGPR